MSAPAANQAYSRADVLRVLSISERQLRSWENRDFIPRVDSYGFSDLLALRTLIRLRDNKISPTQIRDALAALREKMRDVRNPLHELRIYSVGRKIRVEADGQTMEPVSGQLLLDFTAEDLRKLYSFPKPETDHRARKAAADRWFERGLELEQSGASLADITHAYEEALKHDVNSAGALVNLGTIAFNARSFAEAERFYARALTADPDYALAHFNLGNLFDERNDRVKALHHYQAALELYPNYADAHYNLALLLQGSGHFIKAVRHWNAYLKLDPASAWAAIARRELAKLKDATLVRGSNSRRKPRLLEYNREDHD